MRELTRQYGTTYYWGAALLARPRRRHVHAVYALCRLADDIVDDQQVNAHRSVAEIGAELAAFALGLPHRAGRRRQLTTRCWRPWCNTVIIADIDPECFDRFFAAMAMDLHTTVLRDLGRPLRLHGRLGRRDRRDDAAGAGAWADVGAKSRRGHWGFAFQLTQFPA